MALNLKLKLVCLRVKFLVDLFCYISMIYLNDITLHCNIFIGHTLSIMINDKFKKD